MIESSTQPLSTVYDYHKKIEYESKSNVLEYEYKYSKIGAWIVLENEYLFVYFVAEIYCCN